MKILILIALIYGVYRVSQMGKLAQGTRPNKLNQEEDDGYTDFEEVD